MSYYDFWLNNAWKTCVLEMAQIFNILEHCFLKMNV